MDVAPRLSKWQTLSLPEPPSRDPKDIAGFTTDLHTEYEKFLDSMLRKLGFVSGTNGTFAIYPKDPPMPEPGRPSAGGAATPGSSVPGGNRAASSKGPPYLALNYTVVANGPYENLLKIIRDFHQAPVLHEIKSMTLERLNPNGKNGPKTSDLKLELNIEVLQVQGAEKLDGKTRKTPLADPATLGNLVLLPSQYSDFQPLLKNNMFLGKPPPPKPIPTVRKAERLEEMPTLLVREEVTPPPPTRPREELRDVLAFVRLTTLSFDGLHWQASMVNQATADPERQLSLGSQSTFVIRDRFENALVEGKVINISTTLGIYFQTSDGKVYHWGSRESLYDALQNPLEIVAIDQEVVLLKNWREVEGLAVMSNGDVLATYGPRPAAAYGMGVGMAGMLLPPSRAPAAADTTARQER
jgi:hypothetical protein